MRHEPLTYLAAQAHVQDLHRQAQARAAADALRQTPHRQSVFATLARHRGRPAPPAVRARATATDRVPAPAVFRVAPHH
jgi:hypothetical protein